MPVDYAQIARENERKYGTEIDNYGPKLLADRYSDRAHFVFELLQNAEDALAERLDLASNSTLPRAAKFILFKDRLEFRHFGIPFAEKDVRAICDIARSTKHETSGAIGRFGIGFKSVYAFTRSPEVHSCGESFVIESLVRPAAVARKQAAEGETLFVLPFNHAEASCGESHGIIAERLRELGPRTLLFLRHLDEVDWQIEGGGFGRYLRESKREREGVEHITLVGEERGKATMEEHWLVFSRPVTSEDGTSVRVEIAYQLQTTKGKRRAQIQRVKVSRLCVYFATKLDTYLGFLVQGPFHLTPSRETIRENDKWNKALGKEVGKLTADSLSKLKDMGLLSVSALDAMPLEAGPESVNEKELAEVSTTSVIQPSPESSGASVRSSTAEADGERIARTDHLQTRVRVVAGTASESTPESQEMAELRARIDKAGIEAVKAYEQKAGRNATEKPHNHPGYDLESRSQSSEVLRYIEVKSTGSDWNGALLSQTQFQKAQELGDHYWLYVVEDAESPNAEISPIQNPAGLAEKFIFDKGWKEISKALQQTSRAAS